MEIKELRLNTNSFHDLRRFYSDVLCLIVQDSSDSEFKIEIGKSKLIFSEDKSITPYYHFAFNIPENQINEAIEWLKPKVKLLEYNNSPLIDFPNWNAHSVYFYDPAGNIVELIARHVLKNTSTEPFSAQSFLNISEVGMPVEDVKVFHDKLISELGEKLWQGSPDIFAAMGDENGLFIAVTTQRNWFPTGKPCNIYPLTVKIINNKSLSIQIKYSKYKIITE